MKIGPDPFPSVNANVDASVNADADTQVWISP